MKIQHTASWMFIIAFVVTVLIIGQTIIVPFIFALLIWFIVKKFRDLIDKIDFIKKYIPRWIKTILGSLFIFGTLLFIAEILIENIENLAASYKVYASNVTTVAERINDLFKIDVQEEITSFVQEFHFSKYLQSLMNSLSEIIGNAFMIILFSIFIFVDEALFRAKINLIFSERDSFVNYQRIMSKVDKSMSRYIGMKSLISITTSLLCYFVFLGVGIHSALFWAFMVFLLNFIPSVGSVISTLLPALFALLQFGEFIPFLVILFGAGGINLLIGNFVEPKLMGDTLNISPIVTILSLLIWGSMWGVTGMLLCVPITAVLIIILSQFPNTRAAAILLSARGRV